MTRRQLLAATGAGLASAALARAGAGPPRFDAHPLRQAVSRWPFAAIPLAEFCAACREIGLVGVDLLGAEDWPVVTDHGLVVSMGYPTARRDFIAAGFNDPANHPQLLAELEATLPLASQARVPNVIAMFGNRRGRSDAAGISSCIAGLSRIAPLAEESGVTICVELLNSAVDHPDYQGDRTAFGVEVIRGVGSPRVKLLYDIYHMQIMEGDVIRTIRRHISHIGHFHTGGVPGRHEIDDGQELNYRAIAHAIADVGYAGFVAHEFVPTRDPLTSLREAVAECAV